MNSEKTPVNRKTGPLIAKNLIILIVLVAVCSLSIWSWFTYGSTSYANGINIRSKAEGVKVSWDGVNYYENLVERSASNVVAGEKGLALNFAGDGATTPEPLKLITGNGLKFFEPYLNRRLGTQIVDSNGHWQGVNITDANSEGRYIDVELYFRGDTQRDIYLAGDSFVTPKFPTGNYSDYGDFSKDYIAAASRVAFLNADKNACSFIWAPNADVELIEDANGYSKYTTTAEEEITISGGGNVDIDGGVIDDGKSYYFWTFYDDAVVSSYPNDLSNFEARPFTYDSKIRYFVTDVTMYIPTYGGDNPSIPIFINESSSKPGAYSDNYNKYINGADSKNLTQEAKGQYFGVTNTNFNIGDATCSNAMYIINRQIQAGAQITFKLGYDPVNDLLVVLEYQVKNGGSFSLGGQEEDITATVKYYPLESNKNCALVNPTSSIAISSGNSYVKGVMFKDSSTKNNVLPISITTAEQFTATKVGDGYTATYTFKNKDNNKFLTVTNGTIGYGASGSQFTLYYSSEYEGPVLKCGDYYLAVKNGVLTAVKAGEFDLMYAVTVYTGNIYALNTGLESDSQPYQYYDSTTNQLVDLHQSSNPKLFTSTASTAATVKIGNTKIATLTKANAADEYYTAKIVMRIWVEGTDREAKTPLADGIFDLSLHFTSQ